MHYDLKNSSLSCKEDNNDTDLLKSGSTNVVGFWNLFMSALI